MGGAFKWNFSNTASIVTAYYRNMSYQPAYGETYYGNFAIGVDLTTFSHNFLSYLVYDREPVYAS